MADTKISQLPSASSSSGSDLYPLVQGGANKSITFSALSAALLASTTISISIASANGFNGISSGGSTPILTIGTSVTGIVYGNGTGIQAAIASNFPTLNQNTTGTAANITASSNSTLTSLPSLLLPYSQLSGTIPTWNQNTTGNAATATFATSAGSVPYTGLTGTVPTWNQNTTGTAANITDTSNSTLDTLSSLLLPYSQLIGTVPTWNQNTTGNAANIYSASNSSLVTLSSLLLPYSQLIGTIPTWNQNTTGTAANITAASNSTLTSLPSLLLPYSQLSGTTPTWNQNTTGTAANITASSNSTLTTLPSLMLPYSQLSGSVPIWDQNTTGIAANVSGIVAIANGGTNSSTALNNNRIIISSGGAIVEDVAITPHRALVSDDNGIPIASLTTNVELGYVSGVTSAIQAQLNSLGGSSITALHGDVTATGPGSVVATLTATSNSTLTTLSALSLPASQLTGTLAIANGGTNNTGPFTAGSVIFSNGTQLTQDNAKFFWDDTNFTLGIGTNTPQAASVITTINTSGAPKPIWSFSYGAGSSTGLRGDSARGTVGSPTATQLGDILNFVSGRGYGTSQFATSSTGAIGIYANEAFTNTSNATYIAFKTAPTGSVTSAERMRINSTGNVLVGTTTDNGVDALQLSHTSGGVSANYVKFAGATSGYVEIIAPAAPTSYNLALPSTQGVASSYLQNDGSGNLSWTGGVPPVVTNNIDGGTSAALYTSPQIITGGTA